MNEKDEVRPEYDLSKLKFVGQGIYAERYAEGTNIVLLDPDVAQVFTDSKSVNDALRAIINSELAKTSEG